MGERQENGRPGNAAVPLKKVVPLSKINCASLGRHGDMTNGKKKGNTLW